MQQTGICSIQLLSKEEDGVNAETKDENRKQKHEQGELDQDEVIRLSAATQEYPQLLICNVHGVNPKFLEIGKKMLEQQQNGSQAFSKGAYYIGKMVWSKGYKELLKLLQDHQKELAGLEVDLYRTGEDLDQVQEAAEKLELPVRVHPGCDHADPEFHE